jgi:hypothetical protein
LLFSPLKIKAQNHSIGFKMGYTTSSASIPDGNLNIGSGGASQGTDWFKWVNGFQIGVLTNIDIGYDFVHLDLSPQYSNYGFEGNNKMYYRFEDKKKINLDYLDFDIGLSNLNSVVPSKIVAGVGVTPSLLISSKNINDTNNFDLKAYMIIGYRVSQKFSVYAQAKYGFMEVVPESKIKNFQISFNVNIPVFKM